MLIHDLAGDLLDQLFVIFHTRRTTRQKDAFRSEDCPVSTVGRPASKHCLAPCGCPWAKGSRRGVGIPLVIRRTDHLIHADRVSLLIEPPNGDPFLPSFHTSTNARK